MPLLTLTSDIGQQDFLIGAVKGQLLQTNPAFSLIDITHNLSPFNYPQSAYVCRNAIKNFPPGTFHLILVNLFDVKPEHAQQLMQDLRNCLPGYLVPRLVQEHSGAPSKLPVF